MGDHRSGSPSAAPPVTTTGNGRSTSFCPRDMIRFRREGESRLCLKKSARRETSDSWGTPLLPKAAHVNIAWHRHRPDGCFARRLDSSVPIGRRTSMLVAVRTSRTKPAAAMSSSDARRFPRAPTGKPSGVATACVGPSLRQHLCADASRQSATIGLGLVNAWPPRVSSCTLSWH